MASEIEAAAELVLRWDGEFDGGTTRQAAQRLAKWVRDRLAADRAEREERAKPIDAEWCAANGGAIEGGGATWAWFVGRLIVQWHARDGVTLDDGDGNWTFLDVANRGDFGDLLRVLKGGA